MTRHLFTLLWLVSWAAPLVGAQEILVDTVATPTSIFPGDRLDYQITLRVSPGIRLALQDFDSASVSFEPFVLIGREFQEETLADGVVRYRISYRLANYEIGERELEIPGLVFRYEAIAANPDGGPATREMQVPPFRISIKSTLNAPLQESWIRESLPVAPAASYPYWILILGGAGLVLSSFPLVNWAWSKRPRPREGPQRPGRREFARRWDGTLKDLSEANGDVKGHYESLDGLLREYLFYSREIEARGLTRSELEEALKNSSSPSAADELLLRVLQRGEQCRYGPDDPERWGPLLQEDVQALKKVKV